MAAGKLKLHKGKWIAGSLDLLVEILSPSNPERDRLVKRDLYAENGVAEYWNVDVEEQGIEVLRLDGERYAPAGWVRPGQVLGSPRFPSLSFDVAESFRD